jgi:transcriptional regulator with XRE-family HTH domain
MAVNERIRAVRLALNMTQAEFAESIFISNGYIADLENRNKEANPRILHLIALSFGVSEDWLKTGEGGMFISAPEEKAKRVLALFDSLKPEFQDFALRQLDQLLALQNYEQGEG